jgi:Arc/MetJ-type ribon-helix-helix transcriptional regulator
VVLRDADERDAVLSGAALHDLGQRILELQLAETDLERWCISEYYKSMKTNTKSSITLPAAELQLVRALKDRLRIKSNVEVVRRSLRLLKETTDRQALKEQYRAASVATRASSAGEIAALDHLASEGLD